MRLGKKLESFSVFLFFFCFPLFNLAFLGKLFFTAKGDWLEYEIKIAEGQGPLGSWLHSGIKYFTWSIYFKYPFWTSYTRKKYIEKTEMTTNTENTKKSTKKTNKNDDRVSGIKKTNINDARVEN